jgi:peptidyl-tRNA hydrolase, PTH1 family
MAISAVIGLGNPGTEYEKTRHNVGFRVVDELARRWRVVSWERRNHALVGQRSGSRAILLVKPQTFMNLSGDAVVRLCRSAGLTPPECLVIVDDVELPLGQLRVRERGGAGTHNGLRSITEAIGEAFPRLRLGVCGVEPWRDLADYVLAEFGTDEIAEVDDMVVRAAACVEMALHAGLARAATHFNRIPDPQT